MTIWDRKDTRTKHSQELNVPKHGSRLDFNLISRSFFVVRDLQTYWSTEQYCSISISV